MNTPVSTCQVLLTSTNPMVGGCLNKSIVQIVFLR